MGSFAGSAHGDIAYRYNGNIELFGRENAPVEEFVSHFGTHPVQPTERSEPMVYFNRFPVHSIKINIIRYLPCDIVWGRYAGFVAVFRSICSSRPNTKRQCGI